MNLDGLHQTVKDYFTKGKRGRKERVLARNSDNTTSHKAARDLEESGEDERMVHRILTVLVEPEHRDGLTEGEIGDLIGEELYHKIAPRFGLMERRELLFIPGAYLPDADGRPSDTFAPALTRKWRDGNEQMVVRARREGEDLSPRIVQCPCGCGPYKNKVFKTTNCGKIEHLQRAPQEPKERKERPPAKKPKHAWKCPKCGRRDWENKGFIDAQTHFCPNPKCGHIEEPQ